MTKQTPSPSLLLWAACYLLWTILFAVGFWLIFQTRLALMALGELTPANYWILSAADRYAVLLLGAAWLVLALAGEAYLRDGVHKGIFWSRAGRASAWLLGFAALTTLAQLLLN